MSLLSFALYSCSNDDFNIVPTPNTTGISTTEIDKNSNYISEKKSDKFQTDSSAIAQMNHYSAEPTNMEHIKKDAYRQTRISRSNNTRAAAIDGTTNGTPKKTLSNQKVMISGVTGIVPGVYVADIYTTSGQIDLPSNAKDVEFELPDICGYCDWASREEGVIKTTYQTKKDGVNKKYIKWSFYTIVLRYNAAGMELRKVLPKDGAKIYLPYRFVY